MREGIPQQKLKGPWSVEPGSPRDVLEKRQAFEKKTIEGVLSSLRAFAKEEQFTYEIDEMKEGGDISVPSERLASTLGHLKPLLQEANALLEQHGQQFRVHIEMHGPNLNLRIKSLT